jgi:hypothetical protein
MVVIEKYLQLAIMAVSECNWRKGQGEWEVAIGEAVSGLQDDGHLRGLVRGLLSQAALDCLSSHFRYRQVLQMNPVGDEDSGFCVEVDLGVRPSVLELAFQPFRRFFSVSIVALLAIRHIQSSCWGWCKNYANPSRRTSAR